MADDRAQARREAAVLLGVDIEHLSAADSLRVDMISALRLVIDSEQASILSGGSADLGKLNVAVQSLIALLPGRELPAPPVNREDPRAYMWKTYLDARRRGELADPTSTYEGQRRRIAELEAKVAELEAALAGSVPLPDNVVKLRNDKPSPSPNATHASLLPPASAAPAASPQPEPPPPQAAPAYDYDRERGWRDYVLPDGNITSTPFGGGKKYWGPVGS